MDEDVISKTSVSLPAGLQELIDKGYLLESDMLLALTKYKLDHEGLMPPGFGQVGITFRVVTPEEKHGERER